MSMKIKQLYIFDLPIKPCAFVFIGRTLNKYYYIIIKTIIYEKVPITRIYR